MRTFHPRFARNYPRLWNYLLALLVLAAVILLTFPFQYFFGLRFAGTFFIYLMALMIAAWRGYGPGVLVTLLLVLAVPYLVTPNFSLKRTDLMGLAVLLMVSMLISYISAYRAKVESRLQRANDALDERVRLRTAELETANAALEHRVAELENLYRSAASGLGFVDTGLRFVRLNEKLASLHDASVEAYLGKPVREMLPAAMANSVEALLGRVLATGEPVLDQEMHSHGRDWLISYARVKTEEGAVLGVQMTAHDITDRKRFDERLRQTAKLESLGVLAGGIAHDFNNLLVGIMGNASLASEAAPPYCRSLLHEVVTASQRAADLTRQLLAYAGKGRVYTDCVDLSTLVEEIRRLVHASIPKSVVLRLDMRRGLPPVEADPVQLQQIVMNLIINAAEAIGPDASGSVLVSTSLLHADEQYLTSVFGVEDLKPGPYVVLEVHDTGCGMDEATQARIFDPFFTTKFQGRGLGLSAVLGIVRGHKGALKVYSAPGNGTTFKVLLPAAEGRGSVPRTVDRISTLRGAGVVLVVDDEEIVRNMARTTLEFYGYQVMVAVDGRNAVEVFERHDDRIALVLLDLTMPVMSGEEALRRLRAIRPDVPVLLSSGFNETEAVQRFAGKGLAGFVQKPYTSAGLAQKIKEALSQAGSAGPEIARGMG